MTFKVFAISDIDTVKQMFYCDVVLLCKWNDPSLVQRAEEPAVEVDWSKVSVHPDISIKNSLAVELVDSEFGGTYTKLVDKKKGTIFHPYRFRGTCKEFLDLSNFPVNLLQFASAALPV